jgi:hypothetical protein
MVFENSVVKRCEDLRIREEQIHGENYTMKTFCHLCIPPNITNSVAQEREGSSPHSQQPATGPYPEPVESTPHSPSQSP